MNNSCSPSKIKLWQPFQPWGPSCSQHHTVLGPRNPLQGHLVLCRRVLPVSLFCYPWLSNTKCSPVSVTVPWCFSLCPLILQRQQAGGASAMNFCCLAFICDHSWSEWFIAAAFLCTMVLWAWLRRAKCSPQLGMENSQMPLMNFKLLLFLASVAARGNLVIKLNNSY